MHASHLDDHPSPLAAVAAPPFRYKEGRILALASGVPDRRLDQRQYSTPSQPSTPYNDTSHCEELSDHSAGPIFEPAWLDRSVCGSDQYLGRRSAAANGATNDAPCATAVAGPASTSKAISTGHRDTRLSPRELLATSIVDALSAYKRSLPRPRAPCRRCGWWESALAPGAPFRVG